MGLAVATNRLLWPEAAQRQGCARSYRSWIPTDTASGCSTQVRNTGRSRSPAAHPVLVVSDLRFADAEGSACQRPDQPICRRIRGRDLKCGSRPLRVGPRREVGLRRSGVQPRGFPGRGHAIGAGVRRVRPSLWTLCSPRADLQGPDAQRKPSEPPLTRHGRSR